MIKQMTRGQFLRSLWLAAQECKGNKHLDFRAFFDRLSPRHIEIDKTHYPSSAHAMASHAFEVAKEHVRQIPDVLVVMTYAELAYEEYCKTFKTKESVAA